MIASTDHEIAFVLCTFFKGILTKEDNTNITRVDPMENNPQMTDIVVTEDDVLNKIPALRKRTSP